MRPVGHRNPVGTVARGVALAVAAVLFLLPFAVLVRDGLAAVPQVFADGELPFARSLLNSTVVAVLQTVGQLLLCAPAGYGLARIPFRGEPVVRYAIVATLLVPTAVTFVPSFVVVSSLGWLSDLRGLVVPGLFSALNVFLFRQYFRDFPVALEEAGRLDGLSRWGVFRRVVLPNSTGVLAAVAVVDFIASWNQFLWPLVIAQDSSSWTVQVALSSLLTAQNPKVALLFAAAAVSILPIVLVFVLLQRHLVRGVTETGLTGQ
ncbi:carbohydrate ABC transporter permease [Actinosynnema sp. NPDC047251]|uniref:ABC-type transporter, permease subunit n=1 Tax=Saccharothrix espanaensis (strain ATCC 51144 / DSM 44229 / JCM 9112 / NBRC 15066 / NRRL 15764) TaxID=1179773 RepID=K0K003_SACES|nr:carbohydrate ABC transporter permease [Saccharothrix espanaensis]CCH30249.1 ABC-type transporter, permease subunit [Saccharothrix espanaensis DSM 44229]